MSPDTGLRDTIIRVAGELFVKRGYDATSIKQIAEGANCTTAALYYYFEGGKHAILKEVLLAHMPDADEIFEACGNAASLPQLLGCIAEHICKKKADMVEIGRWMLVEFPNMGKPEREVLYEKVQFMHTQMTLLIRHFVEEDESAEMIAWIFMCATFGYGQMFWSLDLTSRVNLPVETFSTRLAEILGYRYV